MFWWTPRDLAGLLEGYENRSLTVTVSAVLTILFHLIYQFLVSLS